MEVMPYLGRGSISRKSKISVGISFCNEEGLNEWEVLSMRILEQAIVDYTTAWKYISRIKKFPADFEKWDDKMYRIAYHHLLKEYRIIIDIRNFLASDWFKALYSSDGLNAESIEDVLQHRCKAAYGAMIGKKRMNAIIKAVHKWASETKYMQKSKGRKKNEKQKKIEL